MYKVKSKLADATAERLVLLDDDTTLDVSGDLAVGSPVPIARRPSSAPATSKAAGPERASVAPRAEDAAADLPDDPERASIRTTRPAGPPEISLHRLDGTTIDLLEPDAGASPASSSRPSRSIRALSRPSA